VAAAALGMFFSFNLGGNSRDMMNSFEKWVQRNSGKKLSHRGHLGKSHRVHREEQKKQAGTSRE